MTSKGFGLGVGFETGFSSFRTEDLKHVGWAPRICVHPVGSSQKARITYGTQALSCVISILTGAQTHQLTDLSEMPSSS